MSDYHRRPNNTGRHDHFSAESARELKDSEDSSEHDETTELQHPRTTSSDRPRLAVQPRDGISTINCRPISGRRTAITVDVPKEYDGASDIESTSPNQQTHDAQRFSDRSTRPGVSKPQRVLQASQIAQRQSNLVTRHAAEDLINGLIGDDDGDDDGDKNLKLVLQILDRVQSSNDEDRKALLRLILAARSRGTNDRLIASQREPVKRALEAIAKLLNAVEADHISQNQLERSRPGLYRTLKRVVALLAAGDQIGANSHSVLKSMEQREGNDRTSRTLPLALRQGYAADTNSQSSRLRPGYDSSHNSYDSTMRGALDIHRPAKQSRGFVKPSSYDDQSQVPYHAIAPDDQHVSKREWILYDKAHSKVTVVQHFAKPNEQLVLKKFKTSNALRAATAFKNELEINNKLNATNPTKHRVTVVDAYILDQKEYFLVMSPFAKGGTLHQKLLGFANIPNRTVKDTHMLQQATGCLTVALASLHENRSGVIRHRDLHTKNVLFHDGEVLLCDFGASLHFDRGKNDFTHSQRPPRMSRYAAPEVISPTLGGRDKQSDVFSLGSMLYEIQLAIFKPAVLREILEDDAWEHHARTPVIRKKCEAIGSPIMSLISTMTAFDPDDRPSAISASLSMLSMGQSMCASCRSWLENNQQPRTTSR